MAEHSFSARSCSCNLARAQGQTCRQQSDHFIYSKPTLSVLFFSTTGCSVLMALVFYYNDMLQKVTIQRTQQFSAFVCYRKNRRTIERTQLNATHAQLLEKLRPIALAETCSFLAIQSLEFQEIWHKNRSETMRMIYHEKSEF